jgi:uncharacterized membrane protein YhaH (DUF805 family)
VVYWLMSHPEYSVAFRSEAAMQTVAKQYEDGCCAGPVLLRGTLFLYWIPQLAVTVRRLHDTGRSGWWMFKPFIWAFSALRPRLRRRPDGGGRVTPSPALMLMA